MADIPTQRIINALDGLYDRLGGWMTVSEMDTITIAKERLKEQEAVEPFHKCIGGNYSLVEDSHFDYCPYCGKTITWAKQEGR